jgi:hypothetical protein
MGERRGAYRVLVGRPEGKNHLEDLDIDGRIILKCMFRSEMGWHALVSSDSGQGQVAGDCECHKWTYGLHKMRGFVD